MDYDAWGNLVASSGSLASGVSQRFVGSNGLRTDVDTGLVYVRHRWLAPALQQFLSRDVLRDPNHYWYVGANPTSYVDVSGRQRVPATGPGDIVVEGRDRDWNVVPVVVEIDTPQETRDRLEGRIRHWEILSKFQAKHKKVFDDYKRGGLTRLDKPGEGWLLAPVDQFNCAGDTLEDYLGVHGYIPPGAPAGYILKALGCREIPLSSATVGDIVGFGTNQSPIGSPDFNAGHWGKVVRGTGNDAEIAGRDGYLGSWSGTVREWQLGATYRSPRAFRCPRWATVNRL